MSSLKIAIAGSGTSGLAAAAFLARDGHNVTVFERFADPQPLGAGLLLQPTGLACLARLGLDGRVLEWGAKIAHLHGQAANGRTIFDIRYGDLSPHLFGLGIHRGALFFILYDEARRLGVRIVTSCDIARSVVKGNARIIFDQKGQEYGPFDLVIDASGARSALRGENDGLKYNKAYPYGAVWGVCEDAEQSFGGNHLRQRYDGASVMIGALAIGKRPADGRKTLAFFWSLPVKT
ncbi:MAG: FAD-dependent oxidoreductase, partial [Alphaproteobacteria bacterium]